MANLQSTYCCALWQLRVNNADSKGDIQQRINSAVASYKNKGITTLSCVITKGEEKVESLLRKEFGFRTGFLFKRRRIYDNSNLKMLVLDLEDYVARTENESAKKS